MKPALGGEAPVRFHHEGPGIVTDEAAGVVPVRAIW